MHKQKQIRKGCGHLSKYTATLEDGEHTESLTSDAQFRWHYTTSKAECQ